MEETHTAIQKAHCVTAENAKHFIACSTDVIHASSIAIEAELIDQEIEEVRAHEAEFAMRTRESHCYRVLRRALIGQANQQFDLGEKLQEIFREADSPMTEEAFDACMDRACRFLGDAAC